MINFAYSQTRTPSVIINVNISIIYWRVQPIDNNPILRLHTLIVMGTTWVAAEEKLNVFFRPALRAVTEKAKRMRVMIKKGR